MVGDENKTEYIHMRLEWWEMETTEYLRFRGGGAFRGGSSGAADRLHHLIFESHRLGAPVAKVWERRRAKGRKG
jgi:hypothetical protein